MFHSKQILIPFKSVYRFRMFLWVHVYWKKCMPIHMLMVVIMYKHTKSIKDIKIRMAVFEFFGYFSWPYFLPEDIFVHSCSDSRVKIQKCQKNKKTSMIISHSLLFRCILVISVRWENELLILHSIQCTICVILGTWLL